METITFNVYKLDELPEEAKKKAIDNNRDFVAEILNDLDGDEYKAVLEKIEKFFDINVYDWEVSTYRPTFFRWRFTDDRWEELRDDPKYLVRYLNEVERWCRKGKYYSTPFKRVPKSEEHPAGLSYKQRRSKVMFERNYALTGTWCSYPVDIWTGEKGWESVRNHHTIGDYVEDLLWEFFGQWKNDMEANESDEAVEDHLLANEYDFTEEGVLYR